MKKNKIRVRKIAMVLLIIIVLSLNVNSQFLTDLWSNTKKHFKGEGLLNPKSFFGESIGYFIRMILVVKVIYGGFIPKYALSFPHNFYEAIMSNPSPYDPGIFNLLVFMIKILQPVYIMLILAAGFYVLFMQSSLSSRSKAKNLLIRLLISMLVLSLSIPIINLLLGLSEGVTESVFGLISRQEIKHTLGGAVHNLFWVYALTAVPHTDIGLPYLTLLFAMAFLPYIVLGLRYILITMFMVLFPLGVFFYTLPWLKGIGKKILEQLIVWIFLQIFIALIIVVFVGIGLTIEDHVVYNAKISLSNLRGMYDVTGMLALTPTGIDVGKYFGFWGVLLGGVIGAGVGVAPIEFLLCHFYEALPATINIVYFVLGATIYAMLAIFPLIWSHHLHDFLP